MSARYDIEGIVADTLSAYLSAQLGSGVTTTCPVVTFYDPMSVDEASRIVVLAPDAASREEAAGNFTVRVEIGIKSRWAQASAGTDWTTHMSRVNLVRGVLWDADLAASLHTEANGLIGVNFVQPERKITTDVREGWYYTPTTLTLEVFAMNQA